MPHSVPSQPSFQDEELPDAPIQVPAELEVEDAKVTEHNTQSTGDQVDRSEQPMDDWKVKMEEALFSPNEVKPVAAEPGEISFEDGDDDDEFLASSTPELKAEEQEKVPINLAPTVRYSDPEVMYAFYQRLFPFRYLFQWLNHSPSPSSDFAHREFTFTLRNDAYLRYQSYPTADLLRRDILNLNPSRFEIGPVYSTNPRERKTLRKASNFKPISKELVFDIDLTDYDEIRVCCSGAKICLRCWQFITMAIKVVDRALRDDFGFKHIMWVYSGRRGAHAWISDKRAREMDDPKRKAIAGYLGLIKGGAQSGKKVNVKRPLHPHLARSLDLLKDHFQTDILRDQDPWASQKKYERLLELLPDRTLNDSLRKKWDSAPDRSSVSKWADIDALAKTGASKTLDAKALLEAKQDIVLEYTYPRLDIEVSKKLNHLLKSPFVVHPGTGRVCVPIDVRRVEEFDPLGVPTVTDLLGEIDSWDSKHGTDMAIDGEGKRMQDYEKTSLKPYVEYFKSFVVGLLKDERVIKREKEEPKGDAMEF